MVTSNSSKEVLVWNMPSELLVKRVHIGCPDAVAVADVILSAAVEFPSGMENRNKKVALHSKPCDLKMVQSNTLVCRINIFIFSDILFIVMYLSCNCMCSELCHYKCH